MRTKLFISLMLVVGLAVATAAFAGVFTKAEPASTPEPVTTAQCSATGQPCCALGDCCLECILCCAIDGCCEECILCCLAMGCDPFCCFPALASARTAAPRQADVCCPDDMGSCAKPASKALACCGDGCCK
jgi:hypothetical protein